jgi:hypothetical protein
MLTRPELRLNFVILHGYRAKLLPFERPRRLPILTTIFIPSTSVIRVLATLAARHDRRLASRLGWGFSCCSQNPSNRLRMVDMIPRSHARSKNEMGPYRSLITQTQSKKQKRYGLHKGLVLAVP